MSPNKVILKQKKQSKLWGVRVKQCLRKLMKAKIAKISIDFRLAFLLHLKYFLLNCEVLRFSEMKVVSFLNGKMNLYPQFSSVQSLSRVWLFATPWIAARQASLSITNSQSSLRFTSIESVMPSSHLILCGPLLLLPSIPPRIRVFSNESTLRMRWPVLEFQLQHHSFQRTPRTDLL